MPEIQELLGEFRKAITEEIEFIKKVGGGSKFAARNGVLIETRHNKYIYEFLIDDPAGLPDDVPIQVRYGQKNIQGSIITVDGIKILISLDQDIGKKIPEITLIADPYYLLEILNRRLEDVENKNIRINLPLVEKLFEKSFNKNIQVETDITCDKCGSPMLIGSNRNTEVLVCSAFPQCKNIIPLYSHEGIARFTEEVCDSIIRDYSPDEQQKQAIAKSLLRDITYIWGPPGTGKTRTLSAIAEIMLKKDLTVLILSHTNVAVDNAIEKIAGGAEKHKNKEYNNGKILRLGNAREGFFNDFPKVDINYWIAKKSKQLIEKRDSLESKLGEYEWELNEKNEALKLLNESKELQVFLLNGRQKYNSLIQQRNDTEAEYRRYVEDLKTTQRKINHAIGMGKIKRFCLGLSAVKLERQREELQKLITSSDQKIETIKSSIKNLGDQLERKKLKLETLKENIYKSGETLPIVIHCKSQSCNQKLRIQPGRFSTGFVTCPQCFRKFEYTFSEEDITEQRFGEETKELSIIINDLRKEIREVNTRISRIETSILKDAVLLATTLTKAYTEEAIYTRQFDIVIVDEASMAPLPMLFFDCGLATQKIIVIGDFRQLAPIARSDTELTKKWLKRDIFDLVGIIDDVDNNVKRGDLVQLINQHRMHQSIMDAVNQPIYGGTLIAASKDDRETQQKERVTVSARPFEGQNIVICDTSAFNPWCSVTTNGSPFNVYSAFLSLHLAESAYYSAVDKDEIGIITPYTAQTRLLHKIVLDRELEIDVASIHRFQGREKELMIFDLVEGPFRRIKWLGSEDIRSDAGRLINVAVTRAKSKIVIIANLNYLEKKLTKNSILKSILTALCNEHPVIDTNTFFNFLPDTFHIEKIIEGEKVAIEKLDIDNENYFFSQAYFYPFFYQDLENCAKEVIIFSPFITEQRTGNLINHFKRLLSNEIKVIIITRPSSEQIKYSRESVNEILDYFRKCGIDVILKKRMHEKLAIIDKSIIWQGSLNILSHRNTTELMTRIKTRETRTSEEILKLFGISLDRIREEETIKERIRNLNKKGFGFCPSCGGKMQVRQGKYGLFLSCENFRKGCKETMQVDERVIGLIYGEDYLICECGAKMVIKYNPKRRSRFLGCPNYPKHKFTRPI